MTPVGPLAPEALRPLLREVLAAVAACRAPAAPTPLYACTAGKLPPAGAWRHRLVLVSDLDTLAHSNGSHWIRQDTGAPI